MRSKSAFFARESKTETRSKHSSPLRFSATTPADWAVGTATIVTSAIDLVKDSSLHACLDVVLDQQLRADEAEHGQTVRYRAISCTTFGRVPRVFLRAVRVLSAIAAPQ